MSIEEAANQFDAVQMKYDGFWVMLHIIDGEMRVVSSGAEVRKVINIPDDGFDDTILIAEWIFGTEWAGKKKLEGMKEFQVHDCIRVAGKDIEDLPYYARYDIMRQAMRAPVSWQAIRTYPIRELDDVWARDGWEGVVFKNMYSGYGSPVGRCKHTFTMDYVFMGCNDGNGKYAGIASDLIGGLYIDGVLTPVCKVGGLSNEQRQEFWDNRESLKGSVFEAYGKGVFKSGALRHPAFLRMRTDKAAKDCRLV